MTIDLAMMLASDTLWAAAKVSLPVLVVTLTVGLLISILQVATQIQEMTLTFVPKIIAVFFTFIILGHWMLVVLTEFASELIKGIPAYF